MLPCVPPYLGRGLVARLLGHHAVHQDEIDGGGAGVVGEVVDGLLAVPGRGGGVAEVFACFEGDLLVDCAGGMLERNEGIVEGTRGFISYLSSTTRIMPFVVVLVVDGVDVLYCRFGADPMEVSGWSWFGCELHAAYSKTVLEQDASEALLSIPAVLVQVRRTPPIDL